MGRGSTGPHLEQIQRFWTNYWLWFGLSEMYKDMMGQTQSWTWNRLHVLYHMVQVLRKMFVTFLFQIRGMPSVTASVSSLTLLSTLEPVLGTAAGDLPKLLRLVWEYGPRNTVIVGSEECRRIQISHLLREINSIVNTCEKPATQNTESGSTAGASRTLTFTSRAFSPCLWGWTESDEEIVFRVLVMVHK